MPPTFCQLAPQMLLKRRKVLAFFRNETATSPNAAQVRDLTVLLIISH